MKLSLSSSLRTFIAEHRTFVPEFYRGRKSVHTVFNERTYNPCCVFRAKGKRAFAFFKSVHFGIGADGLIIPNTNVEDADIGWFFFNSDGSTAQMCGNGMRCFARYVRDKGLVTKDEFLVKTLAGIMMPKILEDGSVRVNMAKPILDSASIPFVPNDNMNYRMAVKNIVFEGNAISMGNPHFVIFVSPSELSLIHI